ncbi:MAG: Ig-like domain-containing protein [Deltaproteobacteria bacterium]|nr:Ig-like domain-containing protein [Deltaproteobacteria bacterium]
MILNDAAGNIAEGATYCRPGDSFRPGLITTPADGVGHQLCPDDLSMGVDELTDANPTNWYVRVMFDELLDPNVEDLVDIPDPTTGMPSGTQMGTLANTQPVTLQCQSVNGGALVNIPYDGYYSPAGNKITWPVGPSLVIVPNEPSRVATQSECQITLKDNIKDKDGNPVPTDERGPFKFKIAPVAAVAANTAPADKDKVDGIAAGVDITFNTPIDPTSFAAELIPGVLYDPTNMIKFTPDPGNDYAFLEAPNEYFFGGDFQVATMYMWNFIAGAKLKDQCGKETTLAMGTVDTGDAGSFTVNPLKFNGIAPFDTQMNAKPSSYIALKFNQYMDPATLDPTEFTLTPAVDNMTIGESGGSILIKGAYKPSTMYTFTLKNGATIDDCPGEEIGACVKSPMGTFTNTADQTVHFTTTALALTGVSPLDNGTVPAGTVKITYTFNFDVLSTGRFSTSDIVTSPNITWTIGAGPTPNTIRLTSTAPVAPGDYTVTLKAGAMVKDKETTPSIYTQAADNVIHFTVTPPAPPAPACF